MNKMVEELVLEFSKLDEIEGIILGGSQATNTTDSGSDYDLYFYYSKEVPIEKRREICDKYFKYVEINNTYWETEDDGILKDDTPVEIIYRDIKWIRGSVERTIVNCEADIGYTTCFVSSIKNSIILCDKSNILNELKTICSVDFPEKLKKNIIRKNYPLLKDEMFSYYNQIKKALGRNDLISVNHRVAALFASYFDIIFAFNKYLHPGEKKILKIIKDNNLTTPKNMEENVLNILKYSGEGNIKILDEIEELVKNLDEML
ncbi:MAG: nucleotidyltransferase domain-containing protein [Clostridium sp.]